MINFDTKTYVKAEVAAFRRNKDNYGTLSNMYPTPLMVGDLEIRTSEALYQACKVPSRPDIQQIIIDQKSPMMAARKGRSCPDIREDWMAQRVNIMYWCLLVKLVQSPKFNFVLESTADMDIVENSTKDSFWGAKPDASYLIGQNVLGQLLMKVRNEMRSGLPDAVFPLQIPDFYLLGLQIPEIEQTVEDRKESLDGMWEII